MNLTKAQREALNVIKACEPESYSLDFDTPIRLRTLGGLKVLGLIIELRLTEASTLRFFRLTDKGRDYLVRGGK